MTDPAYISGLERRLIEGTAGSMEPLLWAFAYNPADRAGCFAGLYESHRNGCTSDGRTNGRETSVPAMVHGGTVLAKNSEGPGWGQSS